MQTSKMYKVPVCNQEGPRYLQKQGNGQLKEAGAKMDRLAKREHIKGKRRRVTLDTNKPEHSMGDSLTC